MYKPRASTVIPKEEENNYYWKSVECLNCGIKDSMAFKKGDEIKIHSCPKCDTCNLIRIN